MLLQQLPSSQVKKNFQLTSPIQLLKFGIVYAVCCDTITFITGSIIEIIIDFEVTSAPAFPKHFITAGT